MSFEDALSEAQKLGYAEADPTADVDAHDAVYKLSILARLAFGASASPDMIHREGISNIGAERPSVCQRTWLHGQAFGYRTRRIRRS